MSDHAEINEIARWLATEMKQDGKGDALAAYMLGVEREHGVVKTPRFVRNSGSQVKQAPDWLHDSHLRSADLRGNRETFDVSVLGGPPRRKALGLERFDLTLVIEAEAKAVQQFLAMFQQRLPVYLEFGEGTLHVGGRFVPRDCDINAERHAVIITARFYLEGPLEQIGAP